MVARPEQRMASCIEKLVSIVSGDLKTDKLNPSVFKWKIGDTKEHFNNRNSFSIFSRCYFCYSFYTTIRGVVDWIKHKMKRFVFYLLGRIFLKSLFALWRSCNMILFGWGLPLSLSLQSLSIPAVAVNLLLNEFLFQLVKIKTVLPTFN